MDLIVISNIVNLKGVLRTRGCNSHEMLYFVTWSSMSCPKPFNSIWHQCSCFLGKCDVCSYSTLEKCPEMETDISMRVQWKKLSRVVVKHKCSTKRMHLHMGP